MSKINIMYLIGSLGSGGAERQLVELARNINKARYRVFIVIYRHDVHFEYVNDVKGVSLYLIEKKLKLDPIFVCKLVKFIRSNRIDIIHSYMHNTNIWGRLAGKLARCKIIIPSIRSTNISPIYYLIERVLVRWTSTVITNSELAKREYLSHISVPSEFVKVIRNGIDLQNIKNIPKIPADELRANYNVKRDDFIIIHVAGIDRNKNQMCLLRAVHTLKIPNLKVLFVGRTRDSVYYEELHRYVKANSLEKAVCFFGEQKDVFSILSASNLLVLTSLRESFPNVVMEAMSMGLPVISSDVGDVRYLVKDGVNGFLFPRDDHQRLSELIYKVYSLDDSERKRMGEAGRKIIEENYSIEKMVEKIEAVYQSAITSGKVANVAKFQEFKSQ